MMECRYVTLHRDFLHHATASPIHDKICPGLYSCAKLILAKAQPSLVRQLANACNEGDSAKVPHPHLPPKFAIHLNLAYLSRLRTVGASISTPRNDFAFRSQSW